METRPAASIVAVTTSDSAKIPITRGIQIDGTAGAVKLGFADGSTITLNSLLVGYLYPYKATMVYATGTAATNIVAIY